MYDFITEEGKVNKDLTKQLNNYLADLGVEYVKLHNLHWNVTGLSFKAVHEYLETLYDETTEYFDAVAEQLRMKGEFPLASLKDFLANASIKELESKEISVENALKVVLEDMELLKSEAQALYNLADEQGELGLTSELEEHIGHYTKQLWFIKSMLK